MIKSASAEAAVIAARFDSSYPGRHTAIAVTRASLLDAGFLQPGGRAQLLAAGAGITVAVGLLLLICGSNVAALLLARGAARQREIALRIALGAGRARIAQELIAEVLVIASAATALGLLTHVLTARVLGAWLPPLRGLVTTAVDMRVLMLATVSTLGVALFFGLAPLRQALRIDCLDAIKGQTTWLGARVSGLRGVTPSRAPRSRSVSCCSSRRRCLVARSIARCHSIPVIRRHTRTSSAWIRVVLGRAGMRVRGTIGLSWSCAIAWRASLASTPSASRICRRSGDAASTRFGPVRRPRLNQCSSPPWTARSFARSTLRPSPGACSNRAIATW